MSKVVISEPAKEDLYQIADYVAQHSPAAALQLMKKFRKKFNMLTNFPQLGRERNDIAIGIRCLVMDNYLIFYQPSDKMIEIWRVRHSAQDLANWFSQL
ncbi:MAG: type II toxin-antitoxin system RelE/ParE family toxin [Acidobacteria bacterium]|nr:type II toxin-antitoxin system RelE/ParE family toxin [Acidobacteriota bacterium]MBI3424652.1 type II toxin-antitoxin system RelE/ParE family toxin [Acidobacteriota bacterium]